MMHDEYELHHLGWQAFQHLANSLAIEVLGTGVSSFSPGKDGGRDGYFEGRSVYPNESTSWEGVWYIQSKFHEPHLSSDSQKWLQNEIRKELNKFNDPESDREWPDNWIVITNVDPSAAPKTGTFDSMRYEIENLNPKLSKRFAIWGGSQVLDLIHKFPHVAQRYGHFLTPGHIVGQIKAFLAPGERTKASIIREIVVKGFERDAQMRLEQAGSQEDHRPKIHELFVDLPYRLADSEYNGYALMDLIISSENIHDSVQAPTEEWEKWQSMPKRAATWFIEAGPGSGKSTIGQMFSQLQRAAILENPSGFNVTQEIATKAALLRRFAEDKNILPHSPRLPLIIVLRDYANWVARRRTGEPTGVLTYLAQLLARSVEEDVSAGLLKDLMRNSRWFFHFDGLDEVPQDRKNVVAQEVISFVNHVCNEVACDALVVCTSRPQGYSDQFQRLVGPHLRLSFLPIETALTIANSVIKYNRTPDESGKAIENLRQAAESRAVGELMRTPLQSQIMAIIVRNGRRPPEQKWHLYENFFSVIYNREAAKDYPEPGLKALLQNGKKLVRCLHNLCGFVLHARAENSDGAETSLSRLDFTDIVAKTVREIIGPSDHRTTELLEMAAEERLVLLSTPEQGERLQFDVRQLQEFFAGEYLYSRIRIDDLKLRVPEIALDSHWREPVHFMISGLIANDRTNEIEWIGEHLSNCDYSKENEEMRPLATQLCLGGGVVARLMEDGVFETDRANRVAFTRIFDSLCRSRSLNAAYTLRSGVLPQTRRWIIDSIWHRLSEPGASCHEVVGGFAILIELIRLEDPEYPGVLEYLKNIQSDVLAWVLPGYRAMSVFSKDAKHGWLFAIVFSRLLSESWVGEDVKVFNWIFRAIKQSSDVESAVRELSETGVELSETEIHLFAVLRNVIGESEAGRKDAPLVSDFGIVKIYEKQFSLDIEGRGFQCDVEVEARGILGVVGKFLKIVAQPRRGDLMSFFSTLDSARGFADSSVGGFIVGLFDRENRSDSSKGLTKLLSKAACGAVVDEEAIMRFVEFDGKFSVQGWNELVSEHFDIAFIALKSSVWRRAELVEFWGNSRLVRRFADKAIDCVSELSWLDLDIWAQLLDEGYRSEELKRALLSMCENLDFERSIFPEYSRDLSSLSIILPADAALLPAILERINLLFELHQFRGDQLVDATEELRKMIKSADSLYEVGESEEYESFIRIAALLLCIIYSGAGECDVYVKKIARILDRDLSVREVRAIMKTLSAFGDPACASSRALVNTLIKVYWSSIKHFGAIESLLNDWREISSSPLSNSVRWQPYLGPK